MHSASRWVWVAGQYVYSYHMLGVQSPFRCDLEVIALLHHVYQNSRQLSDSMGQLCKVFALYIYSIYNEWLATVGLMQKSKLMTIDLSTNKLINVEVKTR